MFFELVSRNSKRSRKENGLFFASLLVTIIAFYIILSLSEQDVMIFLAQMESDAVDRLLLMIPLLYGATLFILFFLIYFASKYQLERRKHEFGVYLMMGMSRSKLFFLLLAEDLYSSIFALCTGLPVAVLISEMTSLVTAKLVGLGIIGHHFSFSLHAVLWTIVGFLVIKCLAFLILSGRIARQEIGDLLVEMPEEMKKSLPKGLYVMTLILGLICLIVAYGLAIRGLAWSKISWMGITLVSGLLGTILFFYGLRVVMGILAERSSSGKGLRIFTFRQLQENVIRRSTTLAVSSLLILAALCCFGSGVAIARINGTREAHVLDYTFSGDSKNAKAVRSTLSVYHMENLFSQLFDMKIGYIRTIEDYDHAFQMEEVMNWLEDQPESDEKDVLLNNLSDATYPHVIALSGYNQLLEAAGKETLNLSEKEASVYMDPDYISPEISGILNGILDKSPEVQIAEEDYHLKGHVQTVSLVTDRSITLSFALILPDDVFEELTQGDYEIYVDGIMNQNETSGKSLLTAISDTNHILDETGLSYESYLQNIGRQLFYTVAASYITIYLAIIFLIIANTVIGVQFLIGQQKTGRRYKTLIRLGATYEDLCQSAKRQIQWFFGIPTVVALISSFFGVRSLFTGIVSSSAKENMNTLMLVSMSMILLLGVIEYIYIIAVKTSSNRYLLSLMVPEREE